MPRRNYSYKEGDWAKNRPRGFKLRAMGAAALAAMLYVGFVALDADLEKGTLGGVLAAGLVVYLLAEVLVAAVLAIRRSQKASRSSGRRRSRSHERSAPRSGT